MCKLDYTQWWQRNSLEIKIAKEILGGSHMLLSFCTCKLVSCCTLRVMQCVQTYLKCFWTHSLPNQPLPGVCDRPWQETEAVHPLPGHHGEELHRAASGYWLPAAHCKEEGCHTCWLEGKYLNCLCDLGKQKEMHSMPHRWIWQILIWCKDTLDKF